MRIGVTAANEGVAVTLMSTDIDGIANGIKDMHEIWANVFELGVAVFLLQRQIGGACFLAVIPAVGEATFSQNSLQVRELNKNSEQLYYNMGHRRHWPRSRTMEPRSSETCHCDVLHAFPDQRTQNDGFNRLYVGFDSKSQGK
jgi:hypothetical protein